MRSLFPLLAQQPELHYLDNAATSQLLRLALDAVIAHEHGHRANVLRGTYALAEAASAAYSEARESVRRFVNASHAREVVFTSGATASINLFAQSFGERLGPGDAVLVTAAEHHSNFVPWQQLRHRRGISLRMLPVSEDGRIDLSELEANVDSRCRLIAVTHCSNVTGAVTDLAPIVRAARAIGAHVLVDGAQYVQHGPVDVRALDVDAYVFSGHKCFAPTGVGVLWARESLLEALPPCWVGGGMVEQVALERYTVADIPHRFEPGTPPIAQAVGLAAALDWMMQLPWATIRGRERALTHRLLSALTAMSDVRLLGPADVHRRLPVVSFNVEGIHPHDLTHVLGDSGICLRGGHHCAQPLHAAFGVHASARASLALYNDETDIDALLEGIERAKVLLQR